MDKNIVIDKNINNLYNFKNTIKYFINIKDLKFSKISALNLESLSWTTPFKFRIRKNEDMKRTLEVPNILNFLVAYNKLKGLPGFNTIYELDPNHKRLTANVDTGDFISGEYDRQMEEDYNKLCVYDILLKLDIKEYYGRIYTHDLEFPKEDDERYLTNMNSGATNGLIMGNYLSLYFAEQYSKNISIDIENEISMKNIDCEFSYFSDDFYFFLNKNDKDSIIKIFEKVLEKYGLERNEKMKTYTYESFNDYNLVSRYWKKIISYCNQKYNKKQDDNKLYFINQLIYRMSGLEDFKSKKVLINNFFKTRYFRELNLEKYVIRDYDYHQLCFLFKFSPEVLLYSIDKFNSMSNFDASRVYKFFEVRYREALKEKFHEEQLYYYYALKILEFDDIIIENKDLVAGTDNQILISYYLKDKLFDEEDINVLKGFDDEEYWFQNYHLILYDNELRSNIEESVNKYLFPKKAKKQPNKKRVYFDFYKDSLEEGTPIIRNIESVNEEIRKYLVLKVEESEAAYEARKEETI